MNLSFRHITCLPFLHITHDVSDKMPSFMSYSTRTHNVQKSVVAVSCSSRAVFVFGVYTTGSDVVALLGQHITTHSALVCVRNRGTRGPVSLCVQVAECCACV